MEMENGSVEDSIADKSKTPMWRVNQLARHHKLQPIYDVVKEEKGKNKKFTVSLVLDEEKWLGYGNTKKQAQQNAANKAIKSTVLKPPPNPKCKEGINYRALTATVRLNGWAMRHGKVVTYTVCEKKYGPSMNYCNSQQQQLPPTPIYFQDFLDTQYKVIPSVYSENFRLPATNYQGSFHYSSRGRPCFFRICVEVGDQKFYGEGSSQQSARHDAAKNALSILEQQASDENVAPSDVAKVKSSVCLLHEEAVPRNMSIVFNTIEEVGPAHLRRYTVEAVVGQFVEGILDKKQAYFSAIGSAFSKKRAKQDAANQILDKMKQLPPIMKKITHDSNRTLHTALLPSSSLHPVSRLLQICQARKVREPMYQVVGEVTLKRGESKFSMKCTLDDKSVVGSGRSKKEAKKDAADKMLSELGKHPDLLKVIPNKDLLPQKSSLKSPAPNKDGSKNLQVKFLESNPKS